MDLGLTIRLLDYAAIFVFAISGGVAAARKGFDPVGFLVLAAAAAVGGGSLRDMLVGRTPAVWLTDPWAAASFAAAAVLVFALGDRLVERAGALRWADALGLAFATAVGVNVGMAAELPFSSVVILGVMTGSFGGLIRDVLCQETPFIFRGEIYATAAAAGAAFQAGLSMAGSPIWLAAPLGAAVTFLLRAIAIRRNLALPAYRRKEPPKTEAPPKE